MKWTPLAEVASERLLEWSTFQELAQQHPTGLPLTGDTLAAYQSLVDGYAKALKRAHAIHEMLERWATLLGLDPAVVSLDDLDVTILRLTSTNVVNLAEPILSDEEIETLPLPPNPVCACPTPREVERAVSAKLDARRKR